MRVKILAFADFPSPYRVEVFKGLAKEYDLFVVFDKMSDQNRNAAWFCKDTGLNSISLLEESGRVQFEKELKKIKKYDLVLAYDYHIKNAIKLELACIKNRVPYIMNLDGAFIRKNFLKNLIKRYLVTHASGYFASGSHAAEYFKYFGADESKIYYHPFTSLHEDEILKKPLSKNEKDTYKGKLELGSKKVVLTIGQFIHRKGFDVLLEAWTQELDDYIIFLNAGDTFYDENVLKNVADYIENNHIKNKCVLYGDYSRKDKLVQVQKKKLDNFYLYRRPLCHQSIFYSREIFKADIRYDINYKISADHDLTLKLWKNKVPFYHVGTVICTYMGDGISETSIGLKTAKHEKAEIVKKYYLSRQRVIYNFIIACSFSSVRAWMVSNRSPEFVRNGYRKIRNILTK